jgi:Protein of unknown function (DUF3383)
MSILPVSNVINVTIETTPQGLQEKNVNSLALFTNETPDNLDPFGIYISASQVASDYGSASITAAMADAVFSQVPNILTGDGRLVIIPLLGSVSATSGKSVTPNISANVAAIIAVTNGQIRVTIDGVAYNLSGLNFTGCLTLADIATVLQAALVNGVVTSNATTITVTSKKVGTGSTVAFAVNAGGTDLTGASYFNTGSATNTAGANSSGETILAAITRTSGQVGYVPIMTNLNLEDAAITAIATGIQALDNMFLHHCSSTADIAGICTTIQQATETKTRMLLYTPGQAAANLMKAAYAGRGFSVDFTGSNTSSTMNLKSLATITPDPGITQTLYAAANTAGVDIYVSYDGVPSVYSTGGNDYFDNPYSDLALKFALEAAGFNYLRQTNTKVPQTEPGMNGLKAAYAGIMQQFVRCGELAPGSWTSSETFGDPQLFVNNILQNGYYIYSLPVAQQNPVDREARRAPLVQIAAKRAGAIQSGNVIVLVND